MEIEVETDGASVKEKKIAKLFSAKKKAPKKIEKKNKTAIEEKIKIASKATGKEKKRNRVVLFVVPLLVVSCFVLGFFTYYYRNKYVQLVKTPTILEKNDRELVLGNVSNLAELPSGEDPIIATAGDVEKLTGQAFSSDVSADDKAVIYVGAKKAIIYRTSSGKIVETTPFSSEEDKIVAHAENQTALVATEAQVAGADTQNADQIGMVAQIVNQNEVGKAATQIIDQAITPIDKRFRVAVYNGTSVKGVAEKMAQTIISVNTNIDVVKKTSAAGDYLKTTVIDLSGNNGQFATDLASAIDGEVLTAVPAGEAVPKADVLVIVGGK
ncbi:MAG: LytR C-terminal domain-containing protein [Parcubacteria group bacterium]|jgi:hypothetical protein